MEKVTQKLTQFWEYYKVIPRSNQNITKRYKNKKYFVSGYQKIIGGFYNGRNLKELY